MFLFAETTAATCVEVIILMAGLKMHKGKQNKGNHNMKIAIIGSTHAGTFSATQIKKLHPDADITVYEQHTTVSFLSCGIALWHETTCQTSNVCL